MDEVVDEAIEWFDQNQEELKEIVEASMVNIKGRREEI